MTRTPRILSVLLLAVLGACTPSTPPAEPETVVEVIREIELTARGLIPENDPSFESVEIYTDRLVLRYSAPPETSLDPVDLGEVGVFNRVIAGTSGEGYLREVLSFTEISPNVFEVTTGQAYLTDLIARGHFTVHNAPGEMSYTEGENVAAVAALDGDVSLLPDLSPCSGSVGAENISVDPSLDINVNFDINVDIDVDATWRPPFVRGRLESADFVVNGAIALGATITADTNGSFGCEVDLVDLARMRGIRIPKLEFTTRFAVGIVPVILNHEVGPTAAVSISGSVETGTATASETVRFSISAGTRYRRTEGGWREVWDPRRSSTGSFTVGEPGDASISAELTAGIEYECLLYGVLGPKIGLEGSLEGTFTANRCEWEGEVTAGINLTGGGRIRIPVIDQTLIEFSLSQELASIPLWTAMGTWPWCEDAGVDAGMRTDGGMGGTDGGGSGTDGGGRDGGTVDGGMDPCASAGNACDTCNARPGCGFCRATGLCQRDALMAGCSDWQDGLAQCIDCTARHSMCGSCMLDGNCGWCANTGTCLTADGRGFPPPAAGCTDWHFVDVTYCM